MAGDRVHLLDVGTIEYGECIVAEIADKLILGDGGHVGDQNLIEGQLQQILGQDPPFDFDLLIVSHCHSDHIGALPKLVGNNTITARWALVSDPDFGWPAAGQDALAGSDAAAAVAAGLREEVPDLTRMSDDDVASFLADAVSLEDNYRTMLATLKDAGCKVVRFQHDHAAQGRLVKAFAKTGVELLGPSRKALDATAARLAGRQQDAATLVQDRLRQGAALDAVSLFRSAASVDADNRSGFLVNLQSTIATLAFDDYKVMLGGDFQFVKPQVKDDVVLAERDRLLAEIQQRAPFDLVKLSHHGSDNAVNDAFLDGLGATPLVGMSSGRGQPKHPPPSTLQLLQDRKADLEWVRTDRNGHVTVEFTPDGPRVSLSSG